MSRRSGVTLVEVLVAIFVMGIGLIALLTLFPIGMLRMARAIHDERSRQAGLNADATAIAYDLRNDKDVVTAVGGTRANGYDYVGAPVDNMDMFANPWPAPGGLKAADPYGESYSIFVDPIGYYDVPNTVARHWVAGSPGVLRRRPVEFVRRGLVAPPVAAVQRRLRISEAFTLWDDILFSPDSNTGFPAGTPKMTAGTALHETRYSWGYTMRRPQTSDRSIVDCSIVVFDKRSLSITGNGVLSEYAYQNVTYFNPTKNTITINYSGVGVVPPPVRAGDWILDATRTNPTPTTGSSHAFWYRIVASEEFVIGGKQHVRFEVQQPIRGFSAPPLVPDPLGTPDLVYQGTAVILDGVAEVFDKGPARLPQ